MFKKCDGNAFSLSQHRVHLIMKWVESIDSAVMLLKALPNLCYSDTFYRTHKTHHHGNHRMMGITSSQQVMITIWGRLYIYAHHPFPLSLFFSVYAWLPRVSWYLPLENISSDQWTTAWRKPDATDEISSSLHPFSPFHLNISFWPFTSSVFSFKMDGTGSSRREKRKVTLGAKKNTKINSRVNTTSSAQQPPIDIGNTRMIHRAMECRSKNAWSLKQSIISLRSG